MLFLLCAIDRLGAAGPAGTLSGSVFPARYDAHRVVVVLRPAARRRRPRLFASSANRATLGVRVASHTFRCADGAFQYAQFTRTATRLPSVPAPLGSGAFYFFSAEAAEAYQLYFKTSMLRVKDVLPGLSIAVGRMGFSSGDETPSGDAAIDRVQRTRIGSRLIGNFDWSMFQRSFDGGAVDVDRRSWSANASLLFPTQGGYEESANPTISSVKVLPASLTAKPALVPHQALQFFAYHYRDQRDLRARPDNNVRFVAPGRLDRHIRHLGCRRRVPPGPVRLTRWSGSRRKPETGTGNSTPRHSAALEVGYRWQSAGRPGCAPVWFTRPATTSQTIGSITRSFRCCPAIQSLFMSTTYAQMNVQDVFAQVSFEPHPRVTAHAEVHRLSLAKRRTAGTTAAARRVEPARSSASRLARRRRDSARHDRGRLDRRDAEAPLVDEWLCGLDERRRRRATNVRRPTVSVFFYAREPHHRSDPDLTCLSTTPGPGSWSGTTRRSVKQFHLHHLAFFDDVRLRGNLDVAVGVRHRRDVARRFERRYGLAIDDAHGIELVPSGRRDDALCERELHRFGRDAAAGAPCGAARVPAACKRSRGRSWGSQACRRPACRTTTPNTVGLPGFTAMP